MKILYLTDQTYLHGGIEKVLSQKANYLAEILGDEVTIITYNQQNKKPSYSFSSKITFLDLGVNYEIGRSYFHPKNLKKVPRHISGLKKVIHHLKPDVIVSTSFGPDFYFLPYVEKSIPKIKEFHSSRYFYHNTLINLRGKFLRYLNRLTEERYSQLVVLNESEKDFYHGQNITVIPNPAEISAEKATFLQSKKVLAAGRISPVKDFASLINIFFHLKDEFPEWELHFFGEDYGGTQGKLETQIKEYGLEKSIIFKGVCNDLKSEMVNYSIYAMTSETECFPMVLLEALSVGLPVISYDSPTGPKHILTNEDDSFLIPYKNLDIYIEKLKHLMSNANLRKEMGAKAIKNVDRFSIEKVMEEWKDLFKAL